MEPAPPLNRNALVFCPKCGGIMVLREPGPGQDFDPFYGCEEYPACRATVRIDRMGEPVPENPLWWI